MRSLSPAKSLRFGLLFLSFLSYWISNAQVDSSINVVDTGVKPKPVYQVNTAISGIISIVGTATNIWAIDKIIHSKKDLTDQELANLRRDIINPFDRWALELDPSKRQDFYKASDYFLPATVAGSAILLLTNKEVSKDWKKILLMYYEMHAITFNIYNFSFFGPNFQNRVRPVAYYDYFPVEERRGGNQRNSMYSGHTASTVASTFFAVKVYSDYHPEIGNKKYLLYGLASIPPLVEGYLRVKALAHFPSDNLIGFALGAATGIIIPQLHKIEYRKVNLTVNDSPFGPQIGIRYKPGISRQKKLKDFRDLASK
jgi:membrane-associated phospholipid phosphatase